MGEGEAVKTPPVGPQTLRNEESQSQALFSGQLGYLKKRTISILPFLLSSLVSPRLMKQDRVWKQESLLGVKEAEISGILDSPPSRRLFQKILQCRESDHFQPARKASQSLRGLSRGAPGGLVRCLHSGTRQGGQLLRAPREGVCGLCFVAWFPLPQCSQ